MDFAELISYEQFKNTQGYVAEQFEALRKIDEEFLNDAGKDAIDTYRILYRIVCMPDDVNDVAKKYLRWKNSNLDCYNGNINEFEPCEKAVVEFMKRYFRFC